MKCPYKYIFGIPRQGFHSTRIFDLAVGDIVGTILLAWLISFVYKTGFVKTLFWTFIVGEILHYLFGVQTQFLTLLGINVDCK